MEEITKKNKTLKHLKHIVKTRTHSKYNFRRLWQ